ncbi:MAG TPA: type II toxin-antitoxin system HicA family toxin [Candidatus Acidoferrales bacterium]|jgi:predicted RNA binding protein YcfA (HicA-like mRNA interferase family)|nr:type II toxin-antitoxin system HicA family toxin [Candidatus Acidoferrales bacterium]
MAHPISRRELIRRFRSLGFTGPVSGGRHQFMMKGTLKVRIPNPHESNTIDGSLVKEILRQASIRLNQWEKA